MSNLVFPFPKSYKENVIFALRRVDQTKDDTHNSDSPSSNYLVVVKPVLLRKSIMTTYLAVLVRENIIVADVVCKLASGAESLRRLRQEAAIYTGPLRSLQGKVVPKFYGSFEGKMEGDTYGCLVTAYCGRSAKMPFFGLPWKTKARLLSALVKVHQAGVKHCDFRECNVVFTPKGTPVIIDFDHAEEHHCEMTTRIKLHEVEPLREEFGCDEIFQACQEAGAWKPRYFYAFFRMFPVEYALDLEMLAACAPKGTDPGLAMDEARGAIYDYKRFLYERSVCDWGGPKEGDDVGDDDAAAADDDDDSGKKVP